MINNTDYHTFEDQESNRLLTLDGNNAQNLLPSTTPKKSNMGCRRFKRVFIFLIGFLVLPLIVYVYFYGFNSPFHFSNPKPVYPHRYGKREATIDWAESSESFDPKEVTGLGIFFKQSITNPTISFKRSAQTNITVDYVIKASSEAAGKESELDITQRPDSWSTRSNECISAEVVVTLPETSTDLGKLVIEDRATADPGKVYFNLDFDGKLNLEKLYAFTSSADLSFGGQKVGHLRIETVSGGIEVFNVQANTVELKTVNGDIKASKVSAIKFSGDSTSGNIYANLASSWQAIAHTTDGKVYLVIQAVDPNLTPDIQFKADSLNGNVSLKVPVSSIGRFSSITLTGIAKLQGDGDTSNVKVTFNSDKWITGYTGETEESGGFFEARTVNGNPKLHFF